MPLIDSIPFTKLKSLKFEDYTDKPLIINDINNPKDINKSLLTASITDTLRIGKFLTSSRGALFIAKQVGLQMMNPKLFSINITGKGNKGFFNNVGRFLEKLDIGGTRTYNLGINTLAQIPLTGVGFHIERHGLSPLGTPNFATYENVVKKLDFENEGNLISLHEKLFNNSNSTSKNKINKFLNNVGELFNKASLGKEVISEYVGGPNSLGGIGKTTIYRYDTTKDNILIKNSLDNTQLRLGEIKINQSVLPKIYNTYENSNVNDLKIDNSFKDKQKSIYNTINNPVIIKNSNSLNNNTYTSLNSDNASYIELKKIIESKKLKQNTFLSREGNEYNSFNLIPNSNNLTSLIFSSTGSVDYINYYGETYKTGRTWNQINRENRIGSGRIDKINLTPLFKDDSPLGGVKSINIGGKEIFARDLIKFRIEAIDNINPKDSIWMVFRSYLKGITDSHSPEWNSVNYSGRGEEFYIYNKTKRQISFSFQVAALSAKEMMPMYQKLNYLASTIYPDYTSDGLMKGNFHKFTIGNYIYRQPCIINSLTYTISDETPWEITMTSPEGGNNDLNHYELPHIIDVQISITLIHNFLPKKSPLSSFIYEEIIKNDPWKQDLIEYDKQDLFKKNKQPKLYNKIL